MIIERNEYVDQLLAKRWNGKIKSGKALEWEDKDYYRVETLWKVIPPLYAL